MLRHGIIVQRTHETQRSLFAHKATKMVPELTCLA